MYDPVTEISRKTGSDWQSSLVYHRTTTMWVGLWLSVSSARTTEQIEPPGGREKLLCGFGVAMANSSR
jgi:hypothetical protein